MKKTKKIYSKTMANSSLAMCYIEECVNKPTEKRFIFYLWDRKNKWYNSRTLIMEEALLINQLMYNEPDVLQELLDNRSLYLFVKRRARAYQKSC